MRRLLQGISWLACLLTIVPSFLFLVNRMGLEHVKLWMLGATIVWFVVTPLWMGREHGKLAPAGKDD
jgi:hypothetical protein